MTLLTKQNKKDLDKAREQHREGLLMWSNNPSNFDNVMDYLYALEKASQRVILSLKHQIEKYGENNQVSELEGLMEEAFAYLNTEEFNKLVKDEFRKEPRIISIGANYNYHVDYNNNFFKTKTRTYTTTFTIKFSNDTKLEWMAPAFSKQDLTKIKENFEDTMHQLEVNKTLTK